MDWIIWVIVIVLIVGVVWWLLNRNSAARETEARTGSQAMPAPTPSETSPTATDTPSASMGVSAPAPIPGATAPIGTPETIPGATAPKPEPVDASARAAHSPETDTDWAEAPAPDGGDVDDWDAGTAASAKDGAASRLKADEDKAEWEAQWSEGSSTASPQQAAAAPPVHHHEYTQHHSPTLPGAESAAAESAVEDSPSVPPAAEAAKSQTPIETEPDAETRQRAESSAASESSLSHSAEPGGHLATEQPYGEGSAAAAMDGSGPEGYTVKGDAESMTYFDETSPAYDETRAGVWFESVAHAEAAGFRPPRRTRLS